MSVLNFFGKVSVILISLLLFSSCFISTKRLSFESSANLQSKHADFNKDSISYTITLERRARNIVIPFFIFTRDKGKFRICYQLKGKGISARTYTCKFKTLELKTENRVIATSKDSLLFTDVKERAYAKDEISPIYKTANLVVLSDPATLKLTMRLEIEVENTSGIKENFIITAPMNIVTKKSFSLFNPLKK